MSLGKLPGIKGLVSGSQGKRRFKNDLSVDMISPPLGDFRHTMHVGRGGDVFGDTSFLSNHGGAGSGDGDSGGSKTAKFFSRTLRHVRKTPVRPRGGSRDLSSPPPPVSPIMKNAISLPQLNLENGCLRRALFPVSPSCPEGSTFSSYGLQSGFVTLPRLSRADRQAQDYSAASDFRRNSFSDDGDYSLPRSDSMTSFVVDLGPSLMSEVFGVIDSPNHVHAADRSWEEEEEEEEEQTSSTPEPPADAPSVNSPFLSPLRPGGAGRGSSRDGEEAGESGDPLKMAAPDEVTRSPSREDPGMAPERFKMAAHVLARHYSTGGISRGPEQTGEEDCPGSANNSSICFQERAPYAYAEDEDEIKV
ncbi:hypothetical protein COCON_G00209600 [Conger conger]|uniref:CRIB domain-containing protein n=1 Tax=Conger conger TaxID=82655 RepID=A0A9Q1HQA4_CONCO|nr:hypothetical protein COCON_G00209600 [Conger conger]